MDLLDPRTGPDSDTLSYPNPFLNYTAAKAWFVDNGGRFHEKCFLDRSSTGVALYARQDIPLDHHDDDDDDDDDDATTEPTSDNVICYCPMNLSISYLNVLPPDHPHFKLSIPHFYDSLAAKLVASTPLHVVSWFFLAEQYLKGKDSPWYYYIAALPPIGDIPWIDEDYVKPWLRGTNLFHATDARNVLWNSWIEKALQILRDAGFRHLDKYNWDLMHWAAQLYSSRGFTSTHIFPDITPPLSILFPVIDFLNHSNDAKVTWAFTPRANPDGFYLETNQSHKRGDQVFNNYGPKSNEELMLGYGFCIKNNPFDHVVMRPVLSHQLDQLSLAFREELAACSGRNVVELQAGVDFFIRRADHPAGDYRAANYPTLLTFFHPRLVRMLIGLSYATSHRVRRNGRAPIDLGKPDQGRLILQAYRNIVKSLEGRVAAIRQNQRENGVPESARQNFAVIYRDSQLDIMLDVIQRYTETVQSLLAVGQRPLPDLSGSCAIVDLTNVMYALRETMPDHYEDFVDGISNEVPDTRDPAEIVSHENADTVFVMLLAFIRTSRVVPLRNGLILLPQAWVSDLMASYTRPIADAVDTVSRPFCESVIELARHGRSPSSVWLENEPENDMVENMVWAMWVFGHEAWHWEGRDVIYVRDLVGTVPFHGYAKEDWLWPDCPAPAEGGGGGGGGNVDGGDDDGDSGVTRDDGDSGATAAAAEDNSDLGSSEAVGGGGAAAAAPRPMIRARVSSGLAPTMPSRVTERMAEQAPSRQPSTGNLYTASNGVNGHAADGPAVNGHAADGPAVNGHAADGPAVNGHAADGPAVNGDAVNGDAVNGRAADGPAVNGDAVNGHAVNGSSSGAN
ncbi:SET domain-containing protein [Pseudovirgaria hyperparasitica]|uniref:SET domain-containing protein n=1 Tax=Pseudovirgaria hyperparasitica TaxID=470096 RepID=A0A6A6VVI2_9PEZI|nr:SET domain-containing protein [Pseudovirgaria hyperparasitica]KAF2753879.1 SET domain-containing protein [Pseudovirgaria hyperparasitica]